MDEINIWLNIAAVIGLAIIGYGGWRVLAPKTALDTISLLEKELDAVRRRLDTRDEENAKLLEQVRSLTVQVVDTTKCATEAKLEADSCKRRNEEQAEQIKDLRQALGRVSRRLERYEGNEPMETLADQQSHEELNRVTIEEGWKELQRRGITRPKQSQQDERQHRQDSREDRQDSRDDDRKPKLEEGE